MPGNGRIARTSNERRVLAEKNKLMLGVMRADTASANQKNSGA
jgi:hypothetical protein